MQEREMYMNLNPYLSFKGDCETAFKFYEQTFSGKIEGILKYAGSPMSEHVPAEWGDKVMHAKLSIGPQTLMGADSPPGGYQQPQGISLTINLNDVAQSERIFNALAEGGNVSMPLQQTFWATSFGMVTDRFGIPWMINCE
jgi:PhnB protein